MIPGIHIDGKWYLVYILMANDTRYTYWWQLIPGIHINGKWYPVYILMANDTWYTYWWQMISGIHIDGNEMNCNVQKPMHMFLFISLLIKCSLKVMRKKGCFLEYRWYYKWGVLFGGEESESLKTRYRTEIKQCHTVNRTEDKMFVGPWIVVNSFSSIREGQLIN